MTCEQNTRYGIPINMKSEFPSLLLVSIRHLTYLNVNGPALKVHFHLAKCSMKIFGLHIHILRFLSKAAMTLLLYTGVQTGQFVLFYKGTMCIFSHTLVSEFDIPVTRYSQLLDLVPKYLRMGPFLMNSSW